MCFGLFIFEFWVLLFVKKKQKQSNIDFCDDFYKKKLPWSLECQINACIDFILKSVQNKQKKGHYENFDFGYLFFHTFACKKIVGMLLFKMNVSCHMMQCNFNFKTRDRSKQKKIFIYFDWYDLKLWIFLNKFQSTDI